MTEPGPGHKPSIDDYADRLIVLEDRIEALHNEQIDLMREVGRIHWRDGWIGKDGRRLSNPMDRFVAAFRFEVDSGCWNWPENRLTDSGYGLFGFDGNSVLAHRWVMQFTKGLELWANGAPLVVDHLCSNKRCVHPAHLEEITQSENVKRGIDRAPPRERATHCKRGHPYSDDNTYQLNGSRWCRKCSSARKLAWQRKNRDKK